MKINEVDFVNQATDGDRETYSIYKAIEEKETKTSDNVFNVFNIISIIILIICSITISYSCICIMFPVSETETNRYFFLLFFVFGIVLLLLLLLRKEFYINRVVEIIFRSKYPEYIKELSECDLIDLAHYIQRTDEYDNLVKLRIRNHIVNEDISYKKGILSIIYTYIDDEGNVLNKKYYFFVSESVKNVKLEKSVYDLRTCTLKIPYVDVLE